MNTAPGVQLVVATVTPVRQLTVVPELEGSLIQTSSTIGSTGRTLHEVYSTLGAAAERHANRAAHSLWMGPHAVRQRIQEFFGDGDEREAKLRELGKTSCRNLEKDCVRLMKYALP